MSNYVMPSRMDPQRTYVRRHRSGNVHFLCTQHDNPLVSVRAESPEGAGCLDKLCALLVAGPDMLAALWDLLSMLSHIPPHDPNHYRIAAALAAIAKAAGKEG